MKQKFKEVVYDFFTELFNRLFQKTPKFFKWWIRIGAIAVFISGVPDILIELDITLPPIIKAFADKVVWVSGIVVMLMAKLPVQRPPVAQTESGKPVVVTDEKTLPFTTKDEEKVMGEAIPPPPVAEDVPDDGGASDGGES
jgi:hypothetical protein